MSQEIFISISETLYYGNFYSRITSSVALDIIRIWWIFFTNIFFTHTFSILSPSFSNLENSTRNLDMQELDYNPSKKDLTDARIHHLLAEELKPYRRVSFINTHFQFFLNFVQFYVSNIDQLKKIWRMFDIFLWIYHKKNCFLFSIYSL
jgi:hypothetical protein